MSDPNVVLAPKRPRNPAPLELLFQADLTFTSASPSDAVISGDTLDGAYIGTGKGTIEGTRISGTASWSLYAGNCLYPLIRACEIQSACARTHSQPERRPLGSSIIRVDRSLVAPDESRDPWAIANL
jgi:hypothetical protein